MFQRLRGIWYVFDSPLNVRKQNSSVITIIKLSSLYIKTPVSMPGCLSM